MRAARLCAELPPEAAIFRGSDLDSRLYSTEAALLRLWINLNLEPKDRIPTAEVAAEREQRQQQKIRRAQRAAQRARRQVSDG